MQERNEWILGVDGGGSKTVACVATVPVGSLDPVGSIAVRGKGESGPGNPCSVGFTTAYENIIEAVDAAISDAALQASASKIEFAAARADGGKRFCLDAACLCLAGIGREEEQRPVLEWGYENGLADKIRVTEDIAPIRWAARYESAIDVARVETSPLLAKSSGSTAFGNEFTWDRSVTLISGTGTIVSVCNADVSDLRVGGWGYLLGDEGSGFAMGLAGLKEVCRAHDHGESLTPFHRMLLHALGCKNPMDLIPRVYTVPIPRPDIATLNRIVLDFAGRDSVALQIVGQAARELSDLVMTGARRMSLAADRYALAMSGGMLTAGSPLVPAVLAKLSEAGMKPAIFHQVREPVLGALAMAAMLGDKPGSKRV